MPKRSAEVLMTPVEQVCKWCSTEVVRGTKPAMLVTCTKCRAKEAAWEAEEPCPSCGARKAPSVAGIVVKGGHRSSCITLAEDITPRRKLTDEDVAEIRHRLGPAPVAL